MAKIEDCLNIDGLKIQTRIGIHAWEQQIDQTLLMDIRFAISPVQPTLDFEEAIDYDAICQAVTGFVAGQPFELIEHVAVKVADLILSTFAVKQVTVKVTKPFAIKNAAGVSVTVTR